MARTLAVFLAILITASPAHAAWMEATTTHFRLIADAPPAWMERYAARLERFDQALRMLYGMPEQEGDTSNRLTVYVVRGDGALQKLYGSKAGNVVGFYMARASGTVAFVSRRSSAGSWDLDSETILKHEYAHHFMLRNYAAIYPPWYVEGFAEFVATAEFTDDGDLDYGKPPRHRAYGLLNGKPLPLREMLAPAEKLGSAQREALYGRGWLMVHYLAFEPNRGGQLSRYLALMNEGISSLEAAERAFGDLDALEKQLDRYLERLRLSYARIPAADLPVGPVSVRSLTPGEAATIAVRMKTDRGVNEEEAAELVVEARRLAEPFADDPDVQVLLAETEYDVGNDDAAEAAADRALAARPQFLEALLYKARARLRRLDKAGVDDAAQWREARGWLVSANRIDNDRAWPLVLYYHSFGWAGEAPTPAAVAGLHRAVELAPQDDGLRMQAVMQYLRDDKPREARALLMPLTFSRHGSAAGAERATRLLSLIDAGRTDAASLALWGRGGMDSVADDGDDDSSED